MSLIKEINQIGIVTNNINRVKKFLEKVGFPPFNIIEIPSLKIYYRGKEAIIDIKIGLSHIHNIQIELIEAGGESIYKEFTDRRGSGIHHLGIYVDDIEDAISRFEEIGIDVIQSGEIYGVKWAYLNTEEELGFILEVIQT
jgi:hypothetical protein